MAISAASSSSQSSSCSLGEKLCSARPERPLAAAYESTRIKLSAAESFGFNIVNVSFSSSSENHGRNDGPPVLSGDMAICPTLSLLQRLLAPSGDRSRASSSAQSAVYDERITIDADRAVVSKEQCDPARSVMQQHAPQDLVAGGSATSLAGAALTLDFPLLQRAPECP